MKTHPHYIPDTVERNVMFLLVLVIVATHAAYFAFAFQSPALAVLAIAGWCLVSLLMKRLKFACTLCGSRDWPRTDTDCPLCSPSERSGD